ncbi:MAG: response regulator [Candidatus Marithrix sp.]
MFNWFNNLKIRNKLVGSFLIVISLTIIVGIVALNNQNHIQTTITKLIDVEGQISELGKQIEIALFMAQRNERYYFANYKQLGFTKARSIYIQQIQDYINFIHNYIAKILQLETEEIDIIEIQNVDQFVNKYETNLINLIDLFEERGFKNDGIIGQFRINVHTIETATIDLKHDKLLIDMLTMRRHEKDYLLRIETKYINKLHTSVTQFKTTVNNTKLTNVQKDQLIILANNYWTKFNGLIEIDNKITLIKKQHQNIIIQLDSLLDKVHTTSIRHETSAKHNIETTTETARLIIIITIISTVILGLFIAIYLANLFSKPLISIAQASKLLSEGNMELPNINKIIARKDEIGTIGRTFEELANYFQEVMQDIVRVSQGLATGNLQVKPETEYRGDFIQIKQALETILTNLRQTIANITNNSMALAEGKLDNIQQDKYQGDFIQIHDSLQSAATKLAATSAENMAQDWLKTGQASLNEQMSGEQDINKLTDNIISLLATYIDAQVGLLYLLQEADQNSYLQIIASYAYADIDKRPNKFMLGEGLVGHVAVKQKVIVINQTAEECPPIIRSGLTNAQPQFVILLPFFYENNLKGIVELGAAKPFTDLQRKFLEQVMTNIGIALNTAESRNQMRILLKQSQRQAEELQQKQQEMQQTNEELQSQSEELQTQSEELQTQQEELKQTNETLEERTRDLEQQKTEIQNKNRDLEINRVEMEKTQAAIVLKAEELEIASKYKSEFLANMSHELRTPLNSLLILAQLLGDNKTGNLNKKQVEYAKTINSAGNDLLTLINDILDLSKVEAGKIEVQWENISLSNLLTTIEQKFLPIADNKGLNFNITIADNVPPILITDSQRVTQIINNLLSNAVKFTSAGEIKITVQRPTDIPSNIGGNKLTLTKTIAISVTDSGIGIAKNKQQTIFEAFQQEDGSTSRSYGGTGLGLSISRQLARLLEGELSLFSEKGAGSTFTLYLPEKTASNITILDDTPLLTTEYKPNLIAKLEQESLPKSTHLPDDRDNLNQQDRSILFIEDDRKFSKILIELAQNKGFKFLLAEDGLTGLQLAEKYNPSAIILDIGLPELNGWGVMERLKDNPDTRHIPVHFMSASDNSIDAKKMGAIGYLLKPVSMENLSDAFRRIEQFLTRTVKNLLMATDIELHQQKIMELVSGENIQVKQALTIELAFKDLQTVSYDCIILDIDIEQGSGNTLLEMMHKERIHCQTPIIVYADRDLTTEEEALLMRCSDEIVIKSVNSPERLLDEATLFLHQIEAKLPNDKRNMLQMVHDKEAILKHKKVLIVDDDVRNVFALATVLEEHDMEVTCATNGKDGLIKLEQHTDVAVILMDIMMPEMDGYETMRAIRNQVKYNKLPIIALTAKAMKDDRAKCIEAGANDYLAKPVDSDKLLSLMRVWLYR